MIEYVTKVLSGEIVAGTKIKQACERFNRDLERSKSDDFPYYYDEEQAEKSCKFIELLPSTDGRPLTLLYFQRWLICELTGWREKETGNRRYNRAFISMSRKNGKTYLVSSLGALTLIMENEPAEARQVYFTANSAKQARLGYNMLKNSLKSAGKKYPSLRKQVKVLQSQITHLPSHSTAMPLATNTSSLDGLAPTLGVLDEFALAKNMDVMNVLKSGMANQKNGLLSIISTAGLNPNCVMKEEYDMLSDVLEEKTSMDRYFIAIWELDSDEEIHDESTWIKANPIFEHNEIKATMLPAIRDDVDIAIQQKNLNSVLVKNFNVWRQSSEDSYISADDWQEVVSDSEDITGNDVYIGIDLSTTGDLSSVGWVVPLGGGKFHVDSHSFVATKYGLQEKIRRDGINYIELEKEGLCTITKLESGIIDYADIFDFIKDLIDRYQLNPLAVCYDPWGSQAFISKAERAGLEPLFEVRQGGFTLSAPITQFRTDVFNGQIQHNGNRLLSYAVNNAITKVRNNATLLDKERQTNRIDPLACIITAYSEAMLHYDETEGKKADNDFYKSNDFGF